jgi:hypothetical protein
MTEDASDNFDTAGRGLLATTWVLAFGPFAVLFFNFSRTTNYQWLWGAFPILLWAFPGAALACAVVLTRRETTIWKTVLVWIAFGMSIFVPRAARAREESDVGNGRLPEYENEGLHKRFCDCGGHPSDHPSPRRARIDAVVDRACLEATIAVLAAFAS